MTKAELPASNTEEHRTPNVARITLCAFLVLMFLYREPNIWSLITGAALVIAGELIRLWGSGYYTHQDHNRSSNYLLVKGPFAYLRYPLYFGNILLYFGIALMSCAIFPYLQVIILVYFSLHYRSLIKREEATARATDVDYYNSVRALLPCLRAYKNSNYQNTSGKFDLKTALRLEANNIKAWSLLAVTIIIIWFIGRY